MPGTVLGLSPIDYHRTKIAAGLNAEQFGSDFFPNGAPSALLMPQTDPGPEAAAGLKQRFREAQAGRDLVVIPQTIKYERIQINPSDSQFIETQRYTVEQICRVFGEDPADHGSAAGGNSQTYANRSDADLARYKRRQFWVTKMQDALGELVPETIAVKLNTSASLMMTARERHEISKLRLDSKTITVNEVRTIDDEAPFPWPEYDEPGIPSGSPDDDTPDMPELPDPELPEDPADPAADPPVEDEETT
jgi:HK97 family phage portal protein